MFHTVNQFPGAEEEESLSPGTGTSNLPMFREASFSALRKSSTSNNTSSGACPLSTQSSNFVTPATASSSSGGIAGPTAGGAGRSASHRALRSRRSGGIEMRAIGGGDHQPTFAGPDHSGFGEGGLFRWDATVAGGGAHEEGDDKDEDEGVPQSVRRGGRRGDREKLRFPPAAGEGAGHIRGPSAEKPWYVILPESRTHQVFDHVGERGKVERFVCSDVNVPHGTSFSHLTCVLQAIGAIC